MRLRPFALMPPPFASADPIVRFPAMVLCVTFTVPLPCTPPPAPLASLPVMLLLEIVILPLPAIPPPSPPKKDERFLRTRERLTTRRAPSPPISIPPPETEDTLL